MVDVPILQIMVIALIIAFVIIFLHQLIPYHEAEFFDGEDVRRINLMIQESLPKKAREEYLNKPEKWWFVKWAEEGSYKRAVFLDLNRAGLKGELDVSDLPRLTRLDCQNNQLTSLKLVRLPNLTALNCHDNRLISLDLSDLPQLTHLDFSNNRLTSLILPRNQSSLTCIFPADNGPPVIVAPKRLKLRTFYGSSNPLSIINPPWRAALTAFVPLANREEKKKILDAQQKTDE